MATTSVARPRPRARKALRIDRSRQRMKIPARAKAPGLATRVTGSRVRGQAQEQILQRRVGRLVTRAQLVGRADGLQLAALDDGDAVTQALGRIEEVRRQEDRASPRCQL